ncbi:MAG TPA: carboxypeptidase-like regulatory domain-containing protein, partial [Planctomycetota bacterium]|nr:carboxypeptidase-like regulatory domain-containing protein [Planctomycetota bacterium]
MKRLLLVLLVFLAIGAAIYVVLTPTRPPDLAGPTPPASPPESRPTPGPPEVPPRAATGRTTAPGPSSTPRPPSTAAGPVVCPASIGAAVRGKVVDASGKPISGVGVWMAGWKGQAPTEIAARWEGECPIEHVARTSEGGEFLFQDLPPDFRYEVRALAPRFVPRRAGPVRPGPGETADLGEITIGPGGRVSGRILDGHERPIRGATVSALPLPAEGRLEELLPFIDSEAGASAGPDGSFLLQDVHPGRVALVAEAFGYARAVLEMQIAPAGESAGLVLRLTDGGTISGTIENSAGEEVEGAVVRAEPEGVGPSFLVEADDFGEFEIDGVPRDVRYRLTVRVPGFAASTAEAKAGDEEVEVKVDERACVQGEVVEANGGEVGYALVTLVPNAPDWRLPVREAGTGSPRTLALDDGTFTIDAPSAGEYRIVAVAPGLAPGASEPFSVTDDRVDGIHVTLYPGTEVRGVVRGGRRLLPAEVSLLNPPRPGETAPDARGGLVPSKGNLLSRTTADRQGKFSFLRAPAGTYVLEAVAEGFAVGRTAPFEIRPGEPTHEATIDLGRTGTIRGTLEGTPATFANFKIISLHEGSPPLEALPDSGGRFSIEDAPPGRHEVVALARTRTTADLPSVDLGTVVREAFAHASVEVPEGGTAEIALAPGAKKGAVIRGIVRRIGAPGTGLAVSVLEGIAPLPFGREAATDGEGRFTLDGLRPGTTTLVVRAASRIGAPGLVLGKTTVEAAEDRPAEVEILVRTGRLRGRVLLPDGTGAAGAQVRIAPDAEGRFTLDGLRPGPTTLIVRA